MISYRDRTFCVSPNCENKCGRQLTDAIKEEAEKWWGGPDAPISVGFFCEGEFEDSFKTNAFNPSKNLNPLTNKKEPT